MFDLSRLFANISTVFSRSDEDRLMRDFDVEFKVIAANFPETLTHFIGSNRMTAETAGRFSTPFKKSTWAALVQKIYQDIQETDPDRFKEKISELFDTDIVGDEYVLDLNLDLDTQETQSTNYFLGFETLPGYLKFKDMLHRHGMLSQIDYYPLENDPDKGGLILSIFSEDGRPLLSCLRDPKPLLRQEAHYG